MGEVLDHFVRAKVHVGEDHDAALCLFEHLRPQPASRPA